MVLLIQLLSLHNLKSLTENTTHLPVSTSSTAPENEQGFYRIGILEAEDGDHGDSHAFQIVQAPSELLALLEVFSIPSHHLIMRRPLCTGSPFVPPTGGLSLEKEIVVRVVDDRSEDADLDGLTEAQEEDLYGSSDLLLDKMVMTFGHQ